MTRVCKNLSRIASVFILSLAFASALSAQESAKPSVWTLEDCIRYAMDNNIQLQQSRNDILSGQEDLAEARAARFPSVNASSSQGTSFIPASGEAPAYSGSYNVGASMTLYNGGKIRNNIRQQEIYAETDSLYLRQESDDIRISIIRAFIQCLYADDNVAVRESTVEASQSQRDRAYEMWKAGSISKVDFTQIESQLYNDKYQLTTAQTSLESYLLQLKQLLELDLEDEMVLDNASLTDEDVLRLLPPKADVYANALEYMPEIRISELNIDAAEIAQANAKAGYLPSISASAGLGSGTRSGNGGFGSQLWNNLNQNVGLSLSVPIYSARKNRTAVNKARIALENSRLSALNARKQVLRDVESTYLDAYSAQAQYVSATEKTRYAQQSYELTREQFNVGMRNTVELITAQNEYSAAQQAELQAKYTALMNRYILDIYQGKHILSYHEE